MTDAIELRSYWEDSLHDLIHTHLNSTYLGVNIMGKRKLNKRFEWLRELRFEPHDFVPMDNNQHLSYDHNFVVVTRFTQGWKQGQNVDMNTMEISHEDCTHKKNLCLGNADEWIDEYNVLTPAVTGLTLHLTQGKMIARFGHYCDNCKRGDGFPDADSAVGHWIMNK